MTVYLLDQPDVFAVMFESMGPRKDETGGYPLPHVKWVNADGSIREARDLPKLPDRNYQPNIVERIAIAFIPPSIPIWSWKELYRIWNLLRIVPAILCACVGWWLGRRNQFSRKAQVVWALHHLLFGLPGLLAFLTVHDWPVKVACPACKKPRAVDRNQCESCGADFAPPAKTGTEIFAPLSAG
ncbi:MAG: hypothetical protein EBS05_17085 [Proteobacteria bacterium]|nr:hypothetical protein [Pseudomonadota bacterium]